MNKYSRHAIFVFLILNSSIGDITGKNKDVSTLYKIISQYIYTNIINQKIDNIDYFYFTGIYPIYKEFSTNKKLIESINITAGTVNSYFNFFYFKYFILRDLDSKLLSELELNYDFSIEKMLEYYTEKSDRLLLIKHLFLLMHSGVLLHMFKEMQIGMNIATNTEIKLSSIINIYTDINLKLQPFKNSEIEIFNILAQNKIKYEFYQLRFIITNDPTLAFKFDKKGLFFRKKTLDTLLSKKFDYINNTNLVNEINRNIKNLNEAKDILSESQIKIYKEKEISLLKNLIQFSKTYKIPDKDIPDSNELLKSNLYYKIKITSSEAKEYKIIRSKALNYIFIKKEYGNKFLYIDKNLFAELYTPVNEEGKKFNINEFEFLNRNKFLKTFLSLIWLTEISYKNISLFLNYGELEVEDQDYDWAKKYKNYLIINSSFNNKFNEINIIDFIKNERKQPILKINNYLFKKNILYIKQNTNSINKTEIINNDRIKQLILRFEDQKFFIDDKLISFIITDIYSININIMDFYKIDWVMLYFKNVAYFSHKKLIFTIPDNFFLRKFKINNLIYKLNVDYDIGLNYKDYKLNIENSYLMFYILSINYATVINNCLNSNLFSMIHANAVKFKTGLIIKNTEGTDEFQFLKVLSDKVLKDLLDLKENLNNNILDVNTIFNNFYYLIILVTNEFKHLAIFLDSFSEKNPIYNVIFNELKKEEEIQKQTVNELIANNYIKLIDLTFYLNGYESVDNIKKFRNCINKFNNKTKGIISFYQRIINIQYIIYGLQVLDTYSKYNNFKYFQYFCCFRGRIYSQHPKIDWINNKLLRHIFTVKDQNTDDPNKFNIYKKYFIDSIKIHKISIYSHKINILWDILNFLIKNLIGKIEWSLALQLMLLLSKKKDFEKFSLETEIILLENFFNEIIILDSIFWVFCKLGYIYLPKKKKITFSYKLLYESGLVFYNKILADNYIIDYSNFTVEERIELYNILEFLKFLNSTWNFNTLLSNNLSIALDSSCNGYTQILNMYHNISYDKYTEYSKMLNLSYSEVSSDFYSQMTEKIKTSAINNINDEINTESPKNNFLKNLLDANKNNLLILNKFIDFHTDNIFNRSTFKKIIMTIPYASTPFNWNSELLDKINFIFEDDLQENDPQDEYKFNEFLKEKKTIKKYILNELIDKIVKILCSNENGESFLDSTSKTALMAYLTDNIKDIEELYLKFDDLKINLLYNEVVRHRFNLEFKDITLNKISYSTMQITNDIDTQKIKQAIIANITHSYDSYIMREMIRESKIPFLNIHDCFKTNIYLMSFLMQQYTIIFYRVHNTNCVYSNLIIKLKDKTEINFFEIIKLYNIKHWELLVSNKSIKKEKFKLQENPYILKF